MRPISSTARLTPATRPRRCSATTWNSGPARRRRCWFSRPIDGRAVRRRAAPKAPQREDHGADDAAGEQRAFESGSDRLADRTEAALAEQRADMVETQARARELAG